MKCKTQEREGGGRTRMMMMMNVILMRIMRRGTQRRRTGETSVHTVEKGNYVKQGRDVLMFNF